MLNRPPGHGPGPAPGDRWVSAHVFTGHPLDLIVSELIPPAAEELRRRGLADRLFFLRHWQGGPHLRLRVRLPDPAAEPTVRAVLNAHATALFRRRPPSSAMSRHEYDALARKLALYEPESPPGTLAPNDTLAFHAYRPEHDKYGHGVALRAVEAAFATCSELALSGVLAGWAPARRTAHCFALITGSMDTGPAAPPRMAAVPPAPEIPAEYRKNRSALLAVARASRVPDVSGADPVSRWLAALRDAQRLAPDPAWLAGHLTHLACNRLGVRLGQEASLRALAVLAVRELTDGAASASPVDGRPHRAAHPAHDRQGGVL
ncbi:lantibiotic dehydratase C-terminal domain-containing protein [Streptomyces sp. NPDC048111]|uniref:lantibiotic dehydratase C-terminal domain-containing protein n=1 Tax=Streptomyces sp. NPDC048111 TaxID=3365500 RepID=UPI003718C4F0